jgi:nucleoside-diphosphate-sugar epimerase
MRYIITGHRGLIGDFIKKRLASEGHTCVRQIDQREGFNVLDLETADLGPDEKVDVFFHLAAHCKINESIARPILSHMSNADGIFAVLEFCRKHGIKKVVVASTSRVLSPERNPYVASKVYVEELTKAYHDCYGIDYIIIRPSTVYGPIFDETSRLINNFLVSAIRGEDLRVFGDEKKTLDFTYVDDFVDGVMLAVNTPYAWNSAYNISGEDEVKLVDVAKEIISLTGSKSKIVFQDPERAQPQQVSIDTSAMKSLGYHPKIKIREGIRKMLEFYKENPSAWQNYIDKGAPFYNGKK